MSNKKQTIHDFDINIIYEYFSNTERQGPGNAEETLKALNFITGLTEKSKIADIGCGTGSQTMTLGQNTPCEIIGIDVWQDFIHKFNQNAINQNLQDRVKGIVGNMENLPFKEEELDLIWADYYAKQTLNIDSFLIKHKGNQTAEEFVSSQRYEAELYNKYKAYYGYMFYIGKRIL